MEYALSETRKKKAIRLLCEGKLSRKEVAESVRVNPKTLEQWLREPGFLGRFYEELSVRQFQDVQLLHRLAQGTYRELLKRLSQDEIGEVSTQHLLQLMERLHRQLKENLQKLENLHATQSAKDADVTLLSEEEYGELAQQVLQKIAERAEGSQTPRAE